MTICTICVHQAHAEITEALQRGQSPTALARTHGVSRSALRRHMARHVSAPVGEASVSAPVSAADQLAAVDEEIAALEAEQEPIRRALETVTDATEVLRLMATERALANRLAAAHRERAQLAPLAAQEAEAQALQAAQATWAAVQARKRAAWDAIDAAVTALDCAWAQLEAVHDAQRDIIPALAPLHTVPQWLLSTRLWPRLGQALRYLQDPNLPHPRTTDPGLLGVIRSVERHSTGYRPSFARPRNIERSTA